MWSLLAATINDWYEDRAQRIGAALACYTIFALTPGLIFLIAVAGLFFGANAEVQIIGQFRELLASLVVAIVLVLRGVAIGATGGRQ